MLGRLFHRDGAAAWNALSLVALSLVRGMTSWPLDEDRSDLEGE